MGKPSKDSGRRSPTYEELVNKNEELRNINLKNAEAHIATNVENKKLLKTIESLRKEVIDLKEEKENNIEELEYQNRKLNEKIESQWEKMYDLEEEKERAEYDLRNILKCDKCDKGFKGKTDMVSHFLSEHIEKDFKCDFCDEDFKGNAALTSHILSNHHENKSKCNTCENGFRSNVNPIKHVNKENPEQINKRNQLLKRHDELVSSIRDQKAKLSNDLYKLKGEEFKQKGKCYCKGKYCAINHATFRWNASQADRIFRNLTSSLAINDGHKQLNQLNITCNKCGQRFAEENNKEKHMKTVHGVVSVRQTCEEASEIARYTERSRTATFVCDDCDKTFPDDDSSVKHRETHHVQVLLESTFVNPSLLN